jgi:hypothetical protein
LGPLVHRLAVFVRAVQLLAVGVGPVPLWPPVEVEVPEDDEPMWAAVVPPPCLGAA